MKNVILKRVEVRFCPGRYWNEIILIVNFAGAGEKKAGTTDESIFICREESGKVY